MVPRLPKYPAKGGVVPRTSHRTIRQASRTVSWGTRQVGVARTALGSARLLDLAIRRPPRGHVRTSRDRLNIAFRYPSQLMPMLVLFQELVEPELGVLPVTLGPGKIAIDVGASIGTWTLSAARTGAVVHACEPDAVNLETLETNIRTNGMIDGVTTHAVALGDHEGFGSVVSTTRRYGNRVDADSGAADPGAAPGQIPVATLDSFVDDLGISEIDVLKVNTAGGEAAVMLGALKLFQAGRVKLAMVLDGLEVRPVIDGLRAHSYDVGVYDGGQRRFVAVPRSADLVAARPSPMNRYILVRRSDVDLDQPCVPT
jgi:FkbM family methyltransferase